MLTGKCFGWAGAGMVEMMRVSGDALAGSSPAPDPFEARGLGPPASGPTPGPPGSGTKEELTLDYVFADVGDLLENPGNADAVFQVASQVWPLALGRMG